MGRNLLVMMGASTPARIDWSQQVPHISRKVELETKGWFLWMYFVHPSMPSMPLAGEKFGEESKNLSKLAARLTKKEFSWQCRYVLDCVLSRRPSGGIALAKVSDQYGIVSSRDSLRLCKWPPWRTNTSGRRWKQYWDPSRVGVKALCLSDTVDGPSVKLRIVHLGCTGEAGL